MRRRLQKTINRGQSRIQFSLSFVVKGYGARERMDTIIEKPNVTLHSQQVKRKCEDVNNGYYFQVEVHEGAPGFADDSSYTSRRFDTFQETYRELVRFQPRRRWPHLRMIQRMYIWKNDCDKVNVNEMSCDACFTINMDDLPKLDVKEHEFDALIESMKA